MGKSIGDRGRGARLARREEGEYYWYLADQQGSQAGWIGREETLHVKQLRRTWGSSPSELLKKVGQTGFHVKR